MGLKLTSSKSAMHAELKRVAAAIDQQVIRYLQRLGEMCLVECRTNKTYMDQTGNLTASMGYVIVAHGRVINSGGFNANYGGEVGRSFALSKAYEIGNGYGLIVVAGMDYAFSVETKGYNVLASAELLAERELPKMMSQLKKSISKLK